MADSASSFPPATPAASATSAGYISAADYAKLAKTNQVFTSFISPTAVDLLTPSTGNVLIPAMAGFYFVVALSKWIITAATGVQASAVVASCGNNAGKNNIALTTTAPANAVVAAAIVAGFPYFTAGPGISAGDQLIDLTTPVTLTITTGAVGPSVLAARLMISGTIIAV